MSRLTTLGLLISLLLAGSMWFYVGHILVPHQKQYAAEHGIPRGNLSDLYPRWLGSRELLLRGRDPYSPETTREIQTGYYGRPLDPSNPADPKDEERFAYPVYVAFLLAPTVKLSFLLVQAIFTILLTALSILTIPLWLRILGWRCSWSSVAMVVIFTLGSFGVVQGIKLQQLTLLVSAFLAAALAALVSGHLMTAGIMIALCTIKPQLALPLTGWLCLWTLADPRRRWRFLAGFGFSMAALITASQFLLPGWLAQFIDAIVQYRRYTGGAASVLDVLLSPAAGRVVAMLIIVIAAVVGWRNRYCEVNSERFGEASALVLAATVVIVPMSAPYNQILLLPAILVILRSLRTLWSAGRLYRWLLILLAMILFEPYISAFGLTLISPLVPKQAILGLWAVPLYTSVALPIAVFATLVLSLRRESSTAELPAAANSA